MTRIVQKYRGRTLHLIYSKVDKNYDGPMVMFTMQVLWCDKGSSGARLRLFFNEGEEVAEAYKKYVADISDLGLIIKSKMNEQTSITSRSQVQIY
ncbi:unnamed protein product [Trifolium pratense]|uniref:Uncharacterized protein n=1 Tax=Trifolium pratense TaxID=57577 RepID=A0ACB0IKA0_TRIPR|nr:unnamed protein product [Trifolium pratense]